MHNNLCVKTNEDNYLTSGDNLLAGCCVLNSHKVFATDKQKHSRNLSDPFRTWEMKNKIKNSAEEVKLVTCMNAT